MKILYHLTNLPPRVANTEASLQEAEMLKNFFGGELVFINPNLNSPIYLPRLLFGFHLLQQIRAKENAFDAHHLYNADPFPFPVLRYLRRPVIYTISSGIGPRRPSRRFFNRLTAVTVSDKRSFQRLKGWGLKNVYLVPPGIDTSRCNHSPLPLTTEFRLLVGSAPWMKSQFQSKGFDALLTTAQQMPNLRLICLWRGVLVEEMEHRVQTLKLENQVEIIDRKVDVNQILAGVHASITLVTHPAIIRAYPHSLLESLAAGKPVIISRSIPMADYVEEHECGTIVEAITPMDILAAVEHLRENYKHFEAATLNLSPHTFSHQTMLASFQELYRQKLNT